MKDNDIALLVNELTAIARDHASAQQLRQRISTAVLLAVRPPLPTPVASEDLERMHFADFMVRQGFGREAVAPPQAPSTTYRSAHIQACWDAWYGCLQLHGGHLDVALAEGKSV